MNGRRGVRHVFFSTLLADALPRKDSHAVTILILGKHADTVVSPLAPHIVTRDNRHRFKLAAKRGRYCRRFGVGDRANGVHKPPSGFDRLGTGSQQFCL